MNFSGNSSIDGTFSNLSNNMSFEAWVLPSMALGASNINQDQYLFGNMGSGAPYGGIAVGNDGIRIREYHLGNAVITLEHKTPITQWTHVAVVYTNSVPSIYINGQLKAAATTTGQYNPTSIHLGYIGFENLYYLPNQPLLNRFQGKLDEVRVWNAAKTATDIANNYQKKLVGNETDLFYYLNLESQNANGSVNSLSGGVSTSRNVANISPVAGPILPNPSAFSWSGANYSSTGAVATVSPTVSGIYTVSVGSSGTCTATLSVGIIPMPCQLSVSPTSGLVNAGQPINLSAKNGMYEGQGMNLSGSSSIAGPIATLVDNMSFEAWVLPSSPLGATSSTIDTYLFGSLIEGNGFGGIAIGTDGVRLREYGGAPSTWFEYKPSTPDQQKI